MVCILRSATKKAGSRPLALRRVPTGAGTASIACIVAPMRFRADHRPAESAGAAISVLDEVLAGAGLQARALGAGHRGFRAEAGGRALDVGVAVRGAVLLAQAEVAGPGLLDPHDLLHDHRKRVFARFSHAACGTVWVEAELPLAAATPELVDAMLGALIEAAELARGRANANRLAARRHPGSRRRRGAWGHARRDDRRTR